MTKRREHKAQADKKTSKSQNPSTKEPGVVNEENCRCKEVSKMTPSGMLRLVISDLAFWKKPTGQK